MKSLVVILNTVGYFADSWQFVLAISMIGLALVGIVGPIMARRLTLIEFGSFKARFAGHSERSLPSLADLRSTSRPRQR